MRHSGGYCCIPRRLARHQNPAQQGGYREKSGIRVTQVVGRTAGVRSRGRRVDFTCPRPMGETRSTIGPELRARALTYTDGPMGTTCGLLDGQVHHPKIVQNRTDLHARAPPQQCNWVGPKIGAKTRHKIFEESSPPGVRFALVR